MISRTTGQPLLVTSDASLHDNPVSSLLESFAHLILVALVEEGGEERGLFCAAAAGE